MKHLKKNSVVLNDLDGLLVNSDNFNQVFIQRIDPQWMTKTIDRVVQSDRHLCKLVQVLVKFTLSECHPEWIYHALRWLTHLFHSPHFRGKPIDGPVRDALRPLLSYATEISGLNVLYQQAAARGSAVEHWAKSSASWLRGVPRKLYYGGLFDVPSTGYTFVDDSSEETDPREDHSYNKSRDHLSKTASLLNTNLSLDGLTENVKPDFAEPYKGEDELSDVGADNIDDDDFTDADDYEEDEADAGFGQEAPPHTYESDHGVFDVNETASSEDQHQPTVLAHSPTAQHDPDILSNKDDEEGSGDLASHDSETSDEELNLLMWSRKPVNDADDSSDSTNSELEDLRQSERPVESSSTAITKPKLNNRRSRPRSGSHTRPQTRKRFRPMQGAHSNSVPNQESKRRRVSF